MFLQWEKKKKLFDLLLRPSAQHPSTQLLSLSLHCKWSGQGHKEFPYFLIPWALLYAQLRQPLCHLCDIWPFHSSSLCLSVYFWWEGFSDHIWSACYGQAHFPQSAPLTWIEYGKSGVNMKDTPQKRVSVPGKGPQGQRQAEGRELRHGRWTRSEEELHDKEGFNPFTL